MIRLAFVFAAVAAVGCRGIYGAPREVSGDAAHPDVGAADAASQLAYGGEVRLERIENMAGQSTTRATAYFIQAENPAYTPLPGFPGCVDARNDSVWPLGQGSAVDRDVGSVVVHPASGDDLALERDSSGDEDFLGRYHTLWWKKLPTFSADDGSMFPDDQTYDLLLGSSAGAPAQEYPALAYMPVAFTPVSPAMETNIVLAAGDFTTTFTPGTAMNRPAGWEPYFQLTFTSPSYVDAAGVELPIVMCAVTSAAQSLTVPATIVDIIRSYTSGDLYRQMIAVEAVSFTDGTVPAKRLDVVGEYELDTTWSAM